MSLGRGERDLHRALADLSANREALPWIERRALAASLGDSLADFDQRAVALRLLGLLADDPKWEVRKEIASHLPLLPDNEFVALAAKLSSDSNSWVRKAANLALDRRKRGLNQTGPRRRGLAQVLTDLDEVELKHGNRITNKVRQLVDQLYDAMAGSTVHELRGVLTPVMSAASRLQAKARRQSRGGGDIGNEVETIATGLELLNRFVDDMRAYSQTVPVERTPSQLEPVITEAHRLVRERLEAVGCDLNGLEVSISVDPQIAVCVARHHVLAAVRNVLSNAYEAVVASDGRRQGRICLDAVGVEGAEVRIVIQDSGIGVSQADLRELRAFIPGRTTKKGSGTGFGLPIAHRNITAHGGTISIESEEGVGTTVTMTLPVEGFSEGGK